MSDPDRTHACDLEIVAVAGPALVQDGGRPGLLHQGVPAGGALVPELLARANAAASNAPGEAAIEVFGSITLAARRSEVRVASDDGAARTLERGELWVLACAGARVRYAAVRGGLAVPRVLAGQGTLLVAGLGGLAGRTLRRGDGLAAGAALEEAGPPPAAPDAGAPVLVVPGPDLRRFAPGALDALLASEYRVSSHSDRLAVRLLGRPIERADADDGMSGPMVRGAIQVPASGEPMVLGPDHPTMGGYPVIATVTTASFGALMARAVGSPVRFAAAPRLW